MHVLARKIEARKCKKIDPQNGHFWAQKFVTIFAVRTLDGLGPLASCSARPIGPISVHGTRWHDLGVDHLGPQSARKFLNLNRPSGAAKKSDFSDQNFRPSELLTGIQAH